MKPRVLITDFAWPSLDIEEEVLEQVGATLVVAESGAEDELAKLAPDVDAILTCWKQVTPDVLAAARNCRVVSRYGVGTDNIAVAQATDLGMLVTRVPDYCTEEVADHAMALLLSCARGLARFDRQTRSGGWDNKGEGTIPRLSEQTLALIGFGNMSRAVAPRAQAFGLTVVAWDPFVAEGEHQGVLVSHNLDGVLAIADYVSIHVPLVEDTHGLFNERRFRAMKQTAYIINTARGPLVDEDALLTALDNRWIAGAALDVLDVEPPRAEHPLVGRRDTIITPHAAFYSESSIRELQRKAAENVVAVLRGMPPPPPYLFNPSVLDQENCRLVR